MVFKLIFPIISLLSILFTIPTTNAYQATFQPRVTLSAEYTDNLERTHEDEQDDIITTLSPGFTLSIFGQSQGIDLDYDPAYAWYQDNSGYNTLRHTANIEIWKQVSRNTRLYIRDAFQYTEDPGAEDLQDDTQDREGREPYYTNTTTAELNNQFGPLDNFTLEYNYRIREEEDDTLDDSVEHNPTASFTYYPFRNFGTETLFSFTQGKFNVEDDDIEPVDDFENYYGSIRLIQRLSQTVSMFIGYAYTLMDYVEEENANYQLHYPNIGASYQLEETTSFNVSVGYLVIDRKVETDTLQDNERLQVSADISKLWQFRTASLSISGVSGYEPASFDPENLGLHIYYDAEAWFNHEFLRDISYEINGSYRVNQYSNVDPESEDRTSTAGVGLIFNRIELMTTRIDYTYRNVESNEPEDEYTENRLSFTITLTPRNPIYLKR